VARGVESGPIYAMLADVYEESWHPENAIPAMRRAIELEPKSERYRFRYAMLLTDTQAPQAAVIRLQEALAEFPRSSRLWFAMGLAQFQDNKTEEATRAFSRALDLDAHTSGGRVTSDFPGTLNKEKTRLAARINGGGTALALETSGGNVNIRSK